MPSLSPWANIMRNPDEEDPTQPVVTPDEEVDTPTPAINNRAQNLAGMRGLLSQYLQKGQGDVSKLEDLASKVKEAQDKQSTVNLSPLLALSDRYFGGNLAKSYTPPPTEAEKAQGLMGLQNMIAKARQPVTQDLLREYGSENNAQSRYFNTLERMQRHLATDSKLTKDQDKAFLQTGQLLESMRGSPAVQQAEKDLYAADKADTLANLYGDPNKLNPQLVQLLHSELAKIATGGVPTLAELQGLDEGTLKSRLAGIWQKFNNEPSQANAGEFVKQYMDYAHGLRNDAQKVIQDRYGRIIESRKNKLNPQDYQSFQDQYINRFKNASTANLATAPTGKTVGKTDFQSWLNSPKGQKYKNDPAGGAAFLKGKGYGVEGF